MPAAVCGLLALKDLVVVRFAHVFGLRKILEQDVVLVQPKLIRMLPRKSILELFISHNAALFRVNQEHAAGLQSAFLQHAF